MLRTTLPGLAATESLASRVAALVRAGDAILLRGPLGAGKTAFARAFLRAATTDGSLDVPSPSYTLVQTYETERGRVHHFDLWRLDGPDALAELGWDEARGDIVIVEWPDRLGPLLGAALDPDATLEIALRPGPDAGPDAGPGAGPGAGKDLGARIAELSGWTSRLEQLA